MPEDVGGTPSPDGGEPDDDRDHGRADEEFAAVVFDEDFVRSAAVHEPSAVERLLAAAQARAEAEHRRRGRTRREHPDDADDGDDRDHGDDRDAYDGFATFDGGYAHGFGHDPERGDPYAPYGHDGRRGRRGHVGCVAHGSAGPCAACEERGDFEPARRTPGRWHRPVAWVLALVMGIGMVALAFTAVYRGNAPGRQDPAPPPATSGVDGSPSVSAGPSVPAGRSAPALPAQPRMP